MPIFFGCWLKTYFLLLRCAHLHQKVCKRGKYSLYQSIYFIHFREREPESNNNEKKKNSNTRPYHTRDPIKTDSLDHKIFYSILMEFFYFVFCLLGIIQKCFGFYLSHLVFLTRPSSPHLPGFFFLFFFISFQPEVHILRMNFLSFGVDKCSLACYLNLVWWCFEIGWLNSIVETRFMSIRIQLKWMCVRFQLETLHLGACNPRSKEKKTQNIKIQEKIIFTMAAFVCLFCTKMSGRKKYKEIHVTVDGAQNNAQNHMRF